MTSSPAVLQTDPPKPVQVVELPKPLPLPGQLKPLPGARSAPEPHDPRQRVDLANAAARVQPSRSGYVNAVQVFPFTDGALYTDRRTYHMELRSTEKTYMASVSWIYPQDQLIALRRQNASADAAAPVDTGLDFGRLRFRYTIEGDNPPWRPLHAFDDGRKVYIEFPRGIAQGEMPPLYIVGPEGKTSELVNYRVRGNHMIVDRL
jgi:P-type conjugative transfer protein TrbG